MPRFRSACVVAVLLALPLASCGKGDKEADLNALDAQLTNDAVDPLLNEALAGKIVVDPKLTGQSNRNATLPVLKGDAAKALAESVKLAGGKLLATPAPTQGEAVESKASLTAVAQEQEKPGGNVFCRKQLAYGMQWASRLPDPFTVYPGGQLKEAAGADKNGCTLRVATFVAPVPRQSVMDFYYTQARRSGFDAEHRLMDGGHVLGGTRKDDGAAFLLMFSDAPGGRTNVDIIADNGQ
ncbi:hypothetical protein BV98_002491 [Sphingobium herbicidovorans NBRC 16415]|jgi:hypothetical protein|uniref:Lipoprotein n=1 Tax=Sphingobium herbicidovorans (strain ATCC 700291 / DSM 11019 / CCUG 56400 / KCTC 2939 / LMG 18315 / NBRC 16415 / MH) TaxID=1219045 RepID=A0A086P8G6_SPHHM|nr:hypothetical protein [Sphingobium herbicidovorans]KFG89684.1 hypothetical protein BV98_002491 [Sphingobium herbicidovorans NBRC 16415]